MKINKKISKYNHYAYTTRNIEYIVIHYVGSVSKAKDNATYFYNGDRQASAHYFVDDNSIWQSVLDKNASWHCGGGLQGTGGHKYYRICTNANSIGIEMCCKLKDGKIYIGEDTIKLTGQLVRYLMKKYNVPAKRVIRHYDVTGKMCPAMYIDETKWAKLHKELTQKTTIKQTVNKIVNTVKKGYSGTLPTLPKRGYFLIGDKGENVLRLQKFLNWYGKYGLALDKSYGEKTANAVRDFERDNKLTVDGSFGKKCLEVAKNIKK